MIDPAFVPSNAKELAACLCDAMWRICSGQLYKIMVKSPDGDGNSVVPFIPNRAQLRLIRRLHTRNIILKARQLGFTTLICILWLDHALFNENQRCGIIAQDREAAEVLFRDKVKLAYENLPTELRERMPLARDSASELLFAHNNSSIRVATSMRSGTIHRLHVSEMGKIGAKFPDKAREIVTGSLPAVPLDGIAIIESTAEGQEGEFYRLTMKAMETAETGRLLTPRDYRFHFAAWWKDPGYRMDPAGVTITTKDHEYFDGVQVVMRTTLDLEQRAWYVATRDSDFSGDPELMWQEYPSTPLEAFQQSTEGRYYAIQLAAARKANRITAVPYVDGVPVNTFWDIGSSDGTAVWLHQRVGLQNRFIGFIEGWELPYSHFVGELQKTGYVWGKHYLPHDAEHKRQQGQYVTSPIEELRAMRLGGQWVIVGRVDDLQHGIQLTRASFSECWFDETACKDGLAHLAGYRKKWNKAAGAWSTEPLKNSDTEAADALRQFGQGYHAPAMTEREDRRRRQRDWKTA